MTVRVRYAPSPTGHLHIGGVRTALFNYLFARHHGGAFILRVEDTDLERNLPGAEQEMLQGFRWLGFEWDEGPDVGGAFGPYRCTERLPVYQQHLDKLVVAGMAYPCYCTPEELKTQQQEALREGKTPQYNGRCRHLSAADKQALEFEGRRASWRFAVPTGQTIEFDDLVRGEVTFESNDIGDFVIVKSNGMPTYQYQVVVDDASMDITHVIRGEEHLPNTPRQIMIYKALGHSIPTFAHLPQVLNHDRKKLSKRDPSVQPVHAYHAQGYLPEAIVNFLALLGWSPGGEEEILSMPDLFRLFDLDRVNHSGAVFDAEKLLWMAGTYFRNAPLEQVTDMVRLQLAMAGVEIPAHADNAWLERVVGLYHEHMACAGDFVTLAQTFFNPDVEWEGDALEVLHSPSAQVVLQRYLELAEADTEWTPEASKARFKQIQAELGLKGRELFMPVRAALTGAIHGPDLQQAIRCLPKAWLLRRIRQALALEAD